MPSGDAAAKGGALRATWLVVSLLAGPTLLVAALVDGLVNAVNSDLHPWAPPLIAVCAIACIACGLAGFAIRAPWWTAVLVALPGVAWLAAERFDDWLWWTVLAVSPIGSLVGSVAGFVIATNRAADEPDA